MTINDVKKKLAIFGATGVVGSKTLEVVEAYPHAFDVVVLTGWDNVNRLEDLARRHHPTFVVASSREESKLRERIADLKDTRVLSGKEGLIRAAQVDVDMVVGGMAGIEGLEVLTMATAKPGRVLALANKESILCGGHLFQEHLAKHGTSLIPIDSEHNALFQLIERAESIRWMHLLASGGPFFGKSDEELQRVSPAQVLQHPVWKLGPKVAVDSATMMNKALELAEAHYLFRLDPDRIVISIHPQGEIHGAITYTDGTTLLHQAVPDMRLPIAYALFWPERKPIEGSAPVSVSALWDRLGQSSFYPLVDRYLVPITIMRRALEEGHHAVIAVTVADELAVQLFMEGKLPYLSMVPFVQKCLENFPTTRPKSLEDVISYVTLLKNVFSKRAATCTLS